MNLPDPNPHGLPIWHIISMVRAEHLDAEWLVLETKEGVTILAGTTTTGPEVDVSGPGYPHRNYRGEVAAERVAYFRRVWETLQERT